MHFMAVIFFIGVTTYTNACELSSCTTDYKPICGIRLSDGDTKTFSNQCVQSNSFCANKYDPYHFYHSGPCVPIFYPRPRCYTQIQCPTNYDPICAKENVAQTTRTFGNQCALVRENCAVPIPYHYTQIYFGPCQDAEILPATINPF